MINTANADVYEKKIHITLEYLYIAAKCERDASMTLYAYSMQIPSTYKTQVDGSSLVSIHIYV
ncbi:hypothetical protein KDI_32080 [Dictyobacter arantiisoli]|uniref:Uncharacterized protein n=1 Tax=Dictyobacter arantiisoli TaxID=2014874 RepID=A0A5A5TFF7_9CHLR|nr:hypothetical protein KDI_32080 [Dictyobacter arantiisoli]